jgi:hypothetical protein
MTKRRTGRLPPVEGGSLPTWVVGISPPKPGLTVCCPSCQGEAQVTAAWPHGGYATRPCTYCWRTAKIPPRLRGGNRKPSTVLR